MAARARALAPGLAVAGAGALLAAIVALALPVVPLLTAAVVLGIVVGQLPAAKPLLDGPLAPGIRFASKTLMRVGIVLLGFRLSLVDIADLGVVAVLAIVALVVATFFATWGFGRAMRLPGDEPLLIAAGFSICGASAIGAMGAATRSDARQQATPVALVTLCGTLAIAVLPLAGSLVGLDPEQFGRWVGASVHDVGQVVATAQTAGAAALAIAVVVKLTRVLMLAPMVAIATTALRVRDRRADAAGTPREGVTGRAPIVPLFVVGFLAAVLVNTLVPLPTPMLEVVDGVQVIVLAAALVALGSAVRIATLVRTGWRALVVGLASWAFIASAALALVTLGS
ncbi:YeiH family protein [Marisediminicola sp. LYQ134]|uniref:YeiH family protein n=1 Tax=unclassified Marisediminicola TaxID=2618316 RepID=UPI00398375E0